jgi:hypothetical protein
MALFSKTSPEKVLQSSLDAARSSRDKIATRLTEATRLVTEREFALQKLVQAAAPDDELIIAERALDEAERREGTLQAGLVEAEVLAEKHERALAELLDAKTRAATSATLLALSLAIEEASAATLAAMAVLSAATSRVAFISESAGLATYALASLEQIPQASEYTIGLLKERARLCIAGEGSAMLPGAEKPFVPDIPTKLSTTRLFALRAVRWRDGAGQLVHSGKYKDVDLTASAAANALASGACVQLNHPSRRTHLGQSPAHVEPHWCTDLDQTDASTESAAESVLHSAFEPLDRGKPYALGIAR